ncbi:MAG TPA: hypothetical protein VGS11_05240 [Candidatus Bathyarchaeia archaeon]|nr:hypothetical protein [Candidatus Bathyarchaeia archaeon]
MTLLNGHSHSITFAVVLLVVIVLIGIVTVLSSKLTMQGCVQQSPGCPIGIVSAQTAAVPPPAGPAIRVTVRNVGNAAVDTLTLVLKVHLTHILAFENITASTPLTPGSTTSESFVLIGDGYVSNSTFQVVISGSLKDGSQFNYTEHMTLS